jgi:putative addiction module killer protein
MTNMLNHVEYYLTESGRCPFTEWLNGLRDKTTTNRIRARITRVSLGGFGVIEVVGQGVSELKLDFGAGYRLYFAMSEKTVVLLLIGGDKSTQKRDIETAQDYWKDYQAR